MVWERLQEVSIDSTDDHKELNFHPSGDWLAVTTDTVGVQIFDTSDWTEATYIQKSGWTGYVGAVDFSPDGNYLAITDQDIGLQVYDVSDPDPANWSEIPDSPLYTGGYGEGAGWTRNTSHVAVANAYNDVRLYSTNDWSEASNSPFFDSSGNLEAVSANSNYLVAGGDESGSIFVLDLETMDEHPSSPLSHPYGPFDVTEFSPSGDYLSIGHSSDQLTVFDTSDDSDPANWFEISESPLHVFGNDVEGTAWYHEDSYVAGGSLDANVRVFDDTFSEISASPVDELVGGTTSIDFDTNNEWLAIIDRNGHAIDIHDAPTISSVEDVDISTVDGSAVGETEVELTGSLDNLWEHDAGLLGFQWREDGTTNAYNQTPLETLLSTGQYTHNVTGLTAGTTYEFRAIGNNGNLDVSTNAASNITDTSMDLNGELTTLDGFTEADVYFDYKKSSASTWNSTSATTLTSTGTFSDTISGLDAGTSYDYRAVTTDGTLTKTGSTMSDTTGGTWETAEDWSSGDFSNWGGYTGGYSIVQDVTVSGSNSAKMDSFNNEIYSHPTDHALSTYPSRGDEYRAHMIFDATDGTTEGFGYLFNNTIPDDGSASYGYDMIVDYANDAWELRRWDDQSVTVLDSGTASVSTGTVYEWHFTSDSTSVSCTVTDEDAGTEVITLSASDSNHDDQGIYVNNYAAAWNDLHEVKK